MSSSLPTCLGIRSISAGPGSPPHRAGSDMLRVCERHRVACGQRTAVVEQCAGRGGRVALKKPTRPSSPCSLHYVPVGAVKKTSLLRPYIAI